MKKMDEFKCCDDPQCGVNALEEVMQSLFNAPNLSDDERMAVVCGMISKVTGGRLEVGVAQVREVDGFQGKANGTVH